MIVCALWCVHGARRWQYVVGKWYTVALIFDEACLITSSHQHCDLTHRSNVALSSYRHTNTHTTRAQRWMIKVERFMFSWDRTSERTIAAWTRRTHAWTTLEIPRGRDSGVQLGEVHCGSCGQVGGDRHPIRHTVYCIRLVQKQKVELTLGPKEMKARGRAAERWEVAWSALNADEKKKSAGKKISFWSWAHTRTSTRSCTHTYALFSSFSTVAILRRLHLYSFSTMDS